MKKITSFVFAILLMANSAFALLPPLAESVKELQAILADSRFAQSLGHAEPIEEVQVTDQGYLFRTRSQSLLVKVNYLASKQPGPAEFDLTFELQK